MISVEFDATAARAYFQKFTPRLIKNLIKHVKRYEIILQSYIVANKLSGNPLHRRSGNLSRSINASEPISTPELVEGSVGTNLPYGYVHEVGGVFDIPSHYRMMTQAFGRPVTPRQILVSAYKANFPQRAFLMPGLAETQEDFKDEINAAVAEMGRPASN